MNQNFDIDIFSFHLIVVQCVDKEANKRILTFQTNSTYNRRDIGS